MVTTLNSLTSTTGSTISTTQDIKYETKEEHATLDKEDFMQLFVTQLQYQDPMNPMDSADMSSQVAQFNMVDLMYKNNEALEKVVTAQNTSASVNALGLLDHKVKFQDDSIYVTDQGVEPFYLMAPDDTELASCQVTISDTMGRLINTLDLGTLAPGQELTLNWDGTDLEGNPVPPGRYNVRIDAQDTSGEDVEIKTWSTGLVSGIETDPEGFPRVIIQDGPTINFDEINKVES